jgi:hypothetical protein
MAQTSGGGTGRQYLLGRLEKAGRTDLLDAIAGGKVSVYAAAEEAGFVRRRAVTGRGSPNAAKRRRFQLQAVLRGTNGPRNRP